MFRKERRGRHLKVKRHRHTIIIFTLFDFDSRDKGFCEPLHSLFVDMSWDLTVFPVPIYGPPLRTPTLCVECIPWSSV